MYGRTARASALIYLELNVLLADARVQLILHDWRIRQRFPLNMTPPTPLHQGLFRKEKLFRSYGLTISQGPLRAEPTRLTIPFFFIVVIILSRVLPGTLILLASSFNEILLSAPINAKILLSTSLLAPFSTPFGVDWR